MADMSNLIEGYCSTRGTFNDDVSSWDVSSVTNMKLIFDDARVFNQAITAWDVSSVTNMHGMFALAYAFDQALAAWDVSRVIDTGGMFQQATAFNQMLCWDMSKIAYTSYMFSGSGTTYAAAINNNVRLLTATAPPTQLPSSLPSPVPSASPSSGPTQSFQTPLSPTVYPLPLPSLPPSLLPTAALITSVSPAFLPSFAPSRFSSRQASLSPSMLPSPLPSSSPTPAPSVTPWFLTSIYFKLSAAAGVVGVAIAALFAGIFRQRLGRWPPLQRTAETAVAIASMGIQGLYSAAAASSSGQFCADCPSEAGWTVFVLGGITCGTILAYRLHQLRFALDTGVALGSISTYALVTLLTCLDGDLVVWLPWIETPATRALAGFPDDSSISFTTWSILLRKVPFFAFTVVNAARSDNSATANLTLIMTGISLAMSLVAKFLLRIAHANNDLDVFVGVRSDASKNTSFLSSKSQSIDQGAIELGEWEENIIVTPRLEDIYPQDSEEVGKNTADVSSRGASGYVGVAASQISTTGWFQIAASAALCIGPIALVVSGQAPSLATIVVILTYIFAAICAVLGLAIVGTGIYYAFATINEGCRRNTIRMSLFEAKEREWREAAEAKERDLREAADMAQKKAETGRRRQEYMANYMHNELGVDPEQLLPFEEVKARLCVILPLVESGKASEEEEAEMARLLILLDANPEAKQQEEEARAVFRAEQAPANATAARRLRSFFPPEARLLHSLTALETAGVSTSVARRLLRNTALTLVMTPPEEIASMHWVDLSKCSSLGLSLFELRAVVASLPVKFATDTAKGEKREWAKGLVEALRSMIGKEAKGELHRKDLCHPCFGTAAAGDGISEGGIPGKGPFDPDLPLTRRPTAMRSEPMSGAEEAQAAAALMTTGKTISERSAAVAALGVRKEKPIERRLVADSAVARRLRERRSSNTDMSTQSCGNPLLAQLAAAAEARQKKQSDDSHTEV